jgi:hypothetical protein
MLVQKKKQMERGFMRAKGENAFPPKPSPSLRINPCGEEGTKRKEGKAVGKRPESGNQGLKPQHHTQSLG